MLHSGNIRHVFFGVFLCLVSMQVLSAEQRIDTKLGTTVRYNDNLRLTETDKESLTGVTLLPSLNMSLDDQLWDVKFNGRVRATRYSSQASLDNNSTYLNTSGSYKTEFSRFQLTGNLDKNTSLDRNINTILKDTGIGSEKWTRKTQTVSTSWMRQLSEDTDMSFNLSRTGLSYEGDIPRGYSGYKTDNLSMAYNWSFSELSRLESSVSLMTYINDLKTFEYEQAIYQLSYTTVLNQTARVSVSAGKRVLKSVFRNQLIGCAFPSPYGCLLDPVYGDIDTENDGNVMSANWSDSGELSKYSFDASRTVVPSSVGGAQQRDSMAIDYKYTINARMNAGLKANSSKNETIGNGNTLRDLKRSMLNASFVYRLSKDLSLSVNYQYIKVMYLSDEVERTSNSIFISLNSAWPRLMSTY